MKIDKKFWFKQSGLTKHAFSYDNAQYVTKFTQQYGGEALDSLTVSDEVGKLLSRDLELCSILVNNGAEVKKETTGLKNRFKIMVSGPDGFKEYDSGHATLRDANNVAKNITKYYTTVVVLRSSVLTTEERNEIL